MNINHRFIGRVTRGNRRRISISRAIVDILTDANDDFDIVGVSMFLVTLCFIFLGVYDLLASHAEYQLLIATAPGAITTAPKFDLQGWGIGAASLLGGHGINALTRRSNITEEREGPC